MSYILIIVLTGLLVPLMLSYANIRNLLDYYIGAFPAFFYSSINVMKCILSFVPMSEHVFFYA